MIERGTNKRTIERTNKDGPKEIRPKGDDGERMNT